MINLGDGFSIQKLIFVIHFAGGFTFPCNEATRIVSFKGELAVT